MPEHTPAPTPARSLYGFFMYLFSKTILVVYIIWAFVPDTYFHYFNIYYYPHKFWSTAIPVQLLVALTIFAFLIYPSLNLMLNVDISSINTLTDPHSNNVIVKSKEKGKITQKCICMDSKKCMKNNYTITTKEIEENTVSPLQDLDIRFVCRNLYLKTNK